MSTAAVITINWSAVIQGTTTGVVGALVFWSFGLAREGIRNLWLRRSIRNQLRFVSCGHGLHGVNTSIHNHLQKAFRVRDVCLITDKANFVFNATGEVSSSGVPEPRKITRDIKARLKRGEMVEISSHVAHRTWNVKVDHVGFVEVKPFTSQGFVLPLQLMMDLKGEAQHLQITVEYETWTKKTRVLTQCTEGWTVEHLKKTLQHVRDGLLNGSLNRARVMFRLPPVPVPAKVADADEKLPQFGETT